MGFGTGSPSDKMPDGIFLQAGLVMLAFRRKCAAQTRITLRLSRPNAGKAVVRSRTRGPAVPYKKLTPTFTGRGFKFFLRD